MPGPLAMLLLQALLVPGAAPLDPPASTAPRQAGSLQSMRGGARATFVIPF